MLTSYLLQQLLPTICHNEVKKKVFSWFPSTQFLCILDQTELLNLMFLPSYCQLWSLVQRNKICKYYGIWTFLNVLAAFQNIKVVGFSVFSTLMFLNRAAVRLGGFLLCLRFILFFSFVGEQTQTPTRPIVITGWCHHQPIGGHFSALFVISPLRSILSS